MIEYDKMQKCVDGFQEWSKRFAKSFGKEIDSKLFDDKNTAMMKDLQNGLVSILQSKQTASTKNGS